MPRFCKNATYSPLNSYPSLKQLLHPLPIWFATPEIYHPQIWFSTDVSTIFSGDAERLCWRFPLGFLGTLRGTHCLAHRGAALAFRWPTFWRWRYLRGVAGGLVEHWATYVWNWQFGWQVFCEHLFYWRLSQDLHVLEIRTTCLHMSCSFW